MSSVAAWVMKIDEALYASVSQMELVHIVNNPESVLVPSAPDYCKNIIIWNDIILPVMDLSCLLSDSKPSATCNIVAVIIYRDSRNKIHYGGINLATTPELEYVENTQLCKLPDHQEKLQAISLSCFKSSDDHKVPILDISKVFSREYAEEYKEQHS